MSPPPPQHYYVELARVHCIKWHWWSEFFAAGRTSKYFVYIFRAIVHLYVISCWPVLSHSVLPFTHPSCHSAGAACVAVVLNFSHSVLNINAIYSKYHYGRFDLHPRKSFDRIHYYWYHSQIMLTTIFVKNNIIIIGFVGWSIFLNYSQSCPCYVHWSPNSQSSYYNRNRSWGSVVYKKLIVQIEDITFLPFVRQCLHTGTNPFASYPDRYRYSWNPCRIKLPTRDNW